MTAGEESECNLSERLQAALAGRYEIVRQIGEGGMAVVCLVRDVKLDRKVALKVLRPELSARVGVERFLLEIKTTAGLVHPHILSLIDAGDADGLPYYTMPFIEGESLAQRLEREHRLPIDESLKIAIDVAAALTHAHRAGVVHRDIKPANILLHDGEALVADFGIVLAVEKAAGDRLTQTGLAVGTPQYMSPEQASGDRQIDARSDVYSLAAVLYEMLAGEPPHMGANLQAVLAKVITERPTRLRVLRDVPEHIEEAVATALANAPEDRFRSCAEFATALSTPGAPRKTRFWTSRIVKRVGAVAAALLGVFAVTFLVVALMEADRAERGRGSAPVMRQVTFSGQATDVSLAPDGQMIAYLTRDRTVLVVQDLAAEREVQLAESDNRLGPPRWSPDGTAVLISGELNGQVGLHSVPRLGGDARLAVGVEAIAGGFDARRPGNAAGAARRLILSGYDYSAGEGSVVAACCGNQIFIGTIPARIQMVAVDSFIAINGALIDLPEEVFQLSDLAVSPDGRWFTFLGRSQDQQMLLGIGATDGSDMRVVLRFDGVDTGENSYESGAIRWPIPGDLIVVRQHAGQGSNILGIPVDRRRGTLSDEPHLLHSVLSAGISIDVSLVHDRLVYTGGPSRAQLQLLDLSLENATSRPVQLTEGTSLHSRPSISPDGMSVAYVKVGPTGWSIYQRQLAGGPEERVTLREEAVGLVAWSPDGTNLAYPAETDDGTVLMISNVSTGDTRRLGTRLTSLSSKPQWSADGSTILYAALPTDTIGHRPGRGPGPGPGPGPGRGIGRSETIQLNVTDGTESQFVLPGFPGRPMFPVFSPDGRSVIAVGGQPGSSTGSPLGMWMVSLEGGSADLLFAGMTIPLVWSQHGEIYFLRNPFERSGRTRIEMITPFGGQSQTLVDLPFPCGFTELSLSRDGKQVICAVADIESDVYMVEQLGLTPGR